MNWTEVTDISIDIPTMEKITNVVIGIVYLDFHFQSTLLFLLRYTVEHNVIKLLLSKFSHTGSLVPCLVSVLVFPMHFLVYRHCEVLVDREPYQRLIPYT